MPTQRKRKQSGCTERASTAGLACSVSCHVAQHTFSRHLSHNWWDPNDAGWGLFIWHDARDRVLAAWFTYGTDGKPIWYTFQPAWDTFAATFPALLTQTSRMPGPTVPPPNPTSYTAVGTASLDFTSRPNATTGAIPIDAGTFTYTFTGGPTTVRNIQRFKP